MSSRTVKVAINGAAGRMGQRLIALGAESKELRIVAAIEAAGNPTVGSQAGPVTITDTLVGQPDVVIDFSLPAGTMAILPEVVKAGAAMVIGTTGFEPAQQAKIDEAARRIPIVQAANMSMGVNLLFKLVAEAAKALGEAYDIEIVEAHHRFKKDAPSGTAMGLAKSICAATGKDLDATLKHGREGISPRQSGEIGMHAVRVGDTIGEHTVYFGSLGETITMGHSAHTRDTFANGALRAAGWVKGKPAGKYSMADVLGL